MTEANVLNLAGADPFDPATLRLDQSFTDGPAVKKLLTTIPVRKPGNQDFVRVHAGEDYRLNTATISLKDDRETYLVAPTLRNELLAECVPVTLYTAMSRQGVLSLWPVRLPGHDGKDMDWWRSAREAAVLAMNTWVRIKANSSLGAYEIFKANGELSAPEWPDLSFSEMLRIAFRDFYIESPDHPVVKRLRGLG